MTKFGPVDFSCCDTNFTGIDESQNTASSNDSLKSEVRSQTEPGQTTGYNAGSDTRIGNMNCQVSPYYRVNPDPLYHPLVDLPGSEAGQKVGILFGNLPAIATKPGRTYNWPGAPTEITHTGWNDGHTRTR